jgi:magnesium transporter
VIVDSAEYEHGVRREGAVSFADVASRRREPGRFVWVGLHEPTEDEFQAVSKAFDLHPLAVEDAVEAHQRPKLEIYDDSLLMVVTTARYDDPSETVVFGELLIFVGEDFVVAVRHGEATSLTGVRSELEADPEHLAVGPGAVLHAILDRVVDDYGPVMTGLDDDIGEIEEQVFSDAAFNPVERIYKLKREVLGVHRALQPLRDPLTRLATQKVPCMPDVTRTYFRDVEDHLIRYEDRNESNRDLLTSILEANLTRVSIRQNEDMRKMSAWVAIAVVPTMIAGIYGMNFRHMPELDTTWGYPLVLLLMATMCTLLYRNFRRSGWL